MQKEVLMHCLEQEGITRTILARALALTHEELDDKMSCREHFTQVERSVIQRLCDMSDQEVKYIFDTNGTD